MANVTATASITNDINLTLIKLGSNLQTESALTDYSVSLTDGTGTLNVNYGVITTGQLPAGGKQYFDFRALPKSVGDLSANVQFNQIKSIIFENRQTLSGVDYTVYATGSLGLNDMFNGGSGNLAIKPRATYIYSDPTAGLVVDGTNRELVLEDGASSSGALYTMIIVGITG